jgi:hypothetical protein
MLGLAGLKAPRSFEGHDFRVLLTDPSRGIREYVFAEDHWHDYEDLGRAARSLRYKYIRNDYPDLPATPPADVSRSSTFQAMRRLKAEGKLSKCQLACFTTPRPAEELYDVVNDPDELHNLAGDTRHARALQELRRAMMGWSQRTGDRIPEARTPDEFDRDTGAPLPNRVRPRPSKKDVQSVQMRSLSGAQAYSLEQHSCGQPG